MINNSLLDNFNNLVFKIVDFICSLGIDIRFLILVLNLLLLLLSCLMYKKLKLLWKLSPESFSILYIIIVSFCLVFLFI